ncbi:MAG: DUF4398 domain-containing protein [Steroidobacteraceae bacterium]
MDTKRTIAAEAPAPRCGGTLLSIAVAMSLAACAPAPTTSQSTSESMGRARTEVRSAEVDVNVRLYAAPDLQQAKHELQLANAAAARHDMDAANQHAYLAAKSAKLAQLYGVAKADEARFADGQAARGLDTTFADVLVDTDHPEMKPGTTRGLDPLRTPIMAGLPRTGRVKIQWCTDPQSNRLQWAVGLR